MKQSLLEVKNLVKQFGKFTAVDHLSLHIGDGEILGFLGPNGAGKTTTIQMLLGVMEPTSGQITYFGKPFAKNREEILKQINFSSTYISLPWLFTVRECLEVFGRLYEVPDREKRIKKLMREFEVEHLEKKQFYQLSAGEKTRLLLAKSFLNYPKLILLDEPTASLDPDIAIKIRQFLKKERMEYNTSVLLTSHNMAEVEELCDRVMIINHGKIVAEDTPDNLAKNITECTIDFLMHNTNKAVEYFKKHQLQFSQDRLVFHVTVDEHKIAELLFGLAHAHVTYQEISINKPTLEDYFLHVIGEVKNNELA